MFLWLIPFRLQFFAFYFAWCLFIFGEFASRLDESFNRISSCDPGKALATSVRQQISTSGIGQFAVVTKLNLAPHLQGNHDPVIQTRKQSFRVGPKKHMKLRQAYVGLLWFTQTWKTVNTTDIVGQLPISSTKNSKNLISAIWEDQSIRTSLRWKEKTAKKQKQVRSFQRQASFCVSQNLLTYWSRQTVSRQDGWSKLAQWSIVH